MVLMAAAKLTPTCFGKLRLCLSDGNWSTLTNAERWPTSLASNTA